MTNIDKANEILKDASEDARKGYIKGLQNLAKSKKSLEKAKGKYSAKIEETERELSEYCEELKEVESKLIGVAFAEKALIAAAEETFRG